MAAGMDQKVMVENKGAGLWCKGVGTPTGAPSLRRAGVVVPQGWGPVSMGGGDAAGVSPCCGCGVPCSALPALPPREG